MKWRCSWRTKWQTAIAVFILILSSYAAVKGYPGALVFGGIWALFLIWLAIENYHSSLALSGDNLTVKGSFGYKVSITRQDLSSAHLGWSIGFKQYPKLGFWLTSSDGTKVFINLRGWDHSRDLFRQLGAWIASSGVQLDDKTTRSLLKAQGSTHSH